MASVMATAVRHSQADAVEDGPATPAPAARVSSYMRYDEDWAELATPEAEAEADARAEQRRSAVALQAVARGRVGRSVASVMATAVRHSQVAQSGAVAEDSDESGSESADVTQPPERLSATHPLLRQALAEISGDVRPSTPPATHATTASGAALRSSARQSQDLAASGDALGDDDDDEPALPRRLSQGLPGDLARKTETTDQTEPEARKSLRASMSRQSCVGLPGDDSWEASSVDEEENQEDKKEETAEKKEREVRKSRKSMGRQSCVGLPGDDSWEASSADGGEGKEAGQGAAEGESPGAAKMEAEAALCMASLASARRSSSDGAARDTSAAQSQAKWLMEAEEAEAAGLPISPPHGRQQGATVEPTHVDTDSAAPPGSPLLASSPAVSTPAHAAEPTASPAPASSLPGRNRVSSVGSRLRQAWAATKAKEAKEPKETREATEQTEAKEAMEGKGAKEGAADAGSAEGGGDLSSGSPPQPKPPAAPRARAGRRGSLPMGAAESSAFNGVGVSGMRRGSVQVVSPQIASLASAAAHEGATGGADALDGCGGSRTSVALGLGSATMFDGNMRRNVRRQSVMAAQIAAGGAGGVGSLGAIPDVAEGAQSSGVAEMLLERRRLLRQAEEQQASSQADATSSAASTGDVAGTDSSTQAMEDGAAALDQARPAEDAKRLRMPLTTWLDERGLQVLVEPLQASGISRLADLVEMEREDIERLGLSPSQLDDLTAALASAQLPRPRQQLRRMQGLVRSVVRIQRLSGLSGRSSGRWSASASSEWGDDDDDPTGGGDDAVASGERPLSLLQALSAESLSPSGGGGGATAPPSGGDDAAHAAASLLLISGGDGSWWWEQPPGEEEAVGSVLKEAHLLALTSPHWPGDAPPFADGDVSSERSGGAYAQYVETFLCSFKAFFSARQLRTHLQDVLTEAMQRIRNAATDEQDGARWAALARRAWHVLSVWLASSPDDLGAFARDAIGALVGRHEQALAPGDEPSRRCLAAVRAALHEASQVAPLSTVRASLATAAATIAAPPADLWTELIGCVTEAEEARLVGALAQQLALHEQSLLGRVRRCELQQLAFAKKNKAELAPHVMALVDHFNKMSRWVCHAVVREKELPRRARALRLFVRVAMRCREVRNFNAVLEVVAALNSASVYRLKRAWELLPAASLADFRVLDRLMRPERSHAALRAAMREDLDAPTVPYLGLYLTDLTFVEDGNADYVHDASVGGGTQLVNLSKCAMVAKVLGEVEHFQRARFAAEPQPGALAWLQQLAPPPDAEIFELSLAAEPRERRHTTTAAATGGATASSWDGAATGGGSLRERSAGRRSSPSLSKLGRASILSLRLTGSSDSPSASPQPSSRAANNGAATEVDPDLGLLSGVQARQRALHRSSSSDVLDSGRSEGTPKRKARSVTFSRRPAMLRSAVSSPALLDAAPSLDDEVPSPAAKPLIGRGRSKTTASRRQTWTPGQPAL